MEGLIVPDCTGFLMQAIHSILLFLLFAAILASAQAHDSPKLTADDGAFTASQNYSLPAKDLPISGLDPSYKIYLRTCLASDDRPQFDLATIEFVVQFHNGHTFFWDAELDKINQPLGFYAAPLDRYWVVQTSSVSGLKPGDIIVKIDNMPMESFSSINRVTSQRPALRRSATIRLLPYPFPEQFTLTLDGELKVEIDREKLNPPGHNTEGRWLKAGVTAYIRIPSFSDFQFEVNALEFMRRFQNAKTLILDVRNNAGGILPKLLIRVPMNNN
jgi:Peptidase family S41